ncbi:hypothetical protein FI667_g8032, partial [Globisporangium splendens]
MDPAAYDEAQYRAQLLRKMRVSEAAVYAAVFAPPAVTSEPILVAATSTGMIHIYVLARMLQPAYWEQVTAQVGGDQDFRVWRWKELFAAATAQDHTFVVEPLHVAHLERKTMGFRGALLPFNEINEVAVARPSGHLFLAGGDSLAHEWDFTTQKFVRQYEGHSDYLHTIRYLTHSQELVTGSEDGRIGLWDVRKAGRVEMLHPQAATTNATSAPSSSSLWVGCVANDASEMWLACGGGKKRTPGQKQSHGFMSMWHLPSRVPVHSTATSSDVHDVVFHHMDLLSVGNEARLKKWNRSSGTLLAAAHSSIPSSHFCVVDDATDIIAVGGNAPLIDIYTMPGVVSFSLLVEEL